MKRLKSNWIIEITGATSFRKIYRFKNIKFPSVFVEIHVAANQNEEAAWSLFYEVLQESKRI